MVEVHVGQPGLGVVAARSHLVVVDGAHPPLVGRVAGAGVEHLVAPHQILVHPEVGLGAVAAHAEDLVAVDPFHLVAVAHDLGAAVAELLGEALLPDVGWLDHVIVDGDDPGNVCHLPPS